MVQRRDRVYPDTATLYPISIADLILRLAEIGLIEMLWTDYLLDETTRVLVGDKHLSASAATYFCDCIRDTFPDGHIKRSAYEHLIATRTGPDPKDHEHSAAASAANVDVVLSADKTGFPRTDTRPAVRRHPDSYLLGLLDDFDDIIIDTIEQMGNSRRQRATVNDTLDALNKAGLVKFVRRLRRSIQDD